MPRELEDDGSDEYLLTGAEFAQLQASIGRLVADRDQARVWAAFHQVAAAREREPMVRLAKKRGLSQDREGTARAAHRPGVFRDG